MSGGIEYLVDVLNAAVESGLQPRTGRWTTISTKHGKTAIIDEDDWWATRVSWHTHTSGANTYFCHAFSPSMHVMLHNILMRNIGRGIDVHHVDGNSLNNQRDNLRYATHSDNIAAAYARNRRQNQADLGLSPLSIIERL